MSKLLIDEYPLVFQPTLACVFGLNQAIVIQQVHYWLSNPKMGLEAGGRKWIRNNLEEWKEENFPFWSIHTISRLMTSLEEKGVILSRSDLNKHAYDRTKWYSLDYGNLQKCKMKFASTQEATCGNETTIPETTINHTDMCQPKNGESSLDEFFPRPDHPAESNGQEQQVPKTGASLESVFYAAAMKNERMAENPKEHPAYLAFGAIRAAYECGELLRNLALCQDACGFDGDHAWLAAAFLTYTGLPTSALTGAGKIARDTRKMWRDEMDVYLADDPLPKVLSYYHYAVEEMVEDGLSINSPRSIRNKVAEIIARSKRANGGERYVARQKV